MATSGLIPKTLEECYPALDALLVQEDKDFLLKAENIFDACIDLHHSLGRHLRNEWGLWQESDLYHHLKVQHGIDHPDDMSHFILEQYVRHRYPTLWERIRADG